MSSTKSSRKLHSTKYAQKKRARFQVLAFLLTLCLVTLTATTVLLARSQIFSVDSVVIKSESGFSTLAADVLEQKALAVVALGTDEIGKALEKEFKSIESLHVRRTGLKTVTVTVKERAAAAVVCAGFREEETVNECYLSDPEGYIFAPASSTPPVNFTRYYVPTDSGSTLVGTSFVSAARFAELESFVHGAVQGGLTPLGVLVGEAGDYEMYVKNKKKDTEVTIYFDDKAPLAATLGNLLTFWASASGPLDYINLRFGNTVYYTPQ